MKQLISMLEPGSQAFFAGDDGKRHLVRILQIPHGHLLVEEQDPFADCKKTLLLIPIDALHPLGKA